MAIHFNCTQCNKALFAQEQYAGRPVVCPACQARNVIPQPPPPQPSGTLPVGTLPGLENETTFIPGKVETPAQVQPLVEGDPDLIDMEKAPITPAPPPPIAPIQPVASVPIPALPTASQLSAQSAPMAAPDNEPTRKCPMCAETIKAAAKKCRFCGAILDESLRTEEEDKRRAAITHGALAIAERSANLWRAIAVLSTGVTIGWLVLLTLRNWNMSAPNLIMLFNPLLIIGLVWSARQMRHGPPHVFFTAALAILLCMPLYLMLGAPFPDAQMQQEIIRQHPEEFDKMKPEQREAMWIALKAVAVIFFAGVDFVFSLPVWIAMMRVAALERLKQTLGNPK